MALSPPRAAASLPQVQGAKASPGMQKQSLPRAGQESGHGTMYGLPSSLTKETLHSFPGARNSSVTAKGCLIQDSRSLKTYTA